MRYGVVPKILIFLLFQWACGKSWRCIPPTYTACQGYIKRIVLGIKMDGVSPSLAAHLMLLSSVSLTPYLEMHFEAQHQQLELPVLANPFSASWHRPKT